jgi:ELWxxDGT repeat protein
VVFVGSTDGATWGVWRSDGTAAGTFQLTTAIPDNYTAPPFITAAGLGRAIFGVNGAPDELWTTDGTVAGTFTLGLHGYTSNFYAAGGLLYGMTFDGTTSTPVRSDGTVSGTVALAGVPSGDANTNYQFAGDASHVFVRAFTPTAAKLYQYLPGANTASMLGSYPRLSTSPYTTWTLAQGVLYFDNDQATTGREPWTSDGTAPNTRLLYDTAPETQTGSSAPSDFASLNDRLYFAADDGVHGRELWTSDGTASGTQLVADLVAGAQGSSPVQLFAAAGELFFFAQDANGDYQLWASKGSAATTIALATVAPNPQSLLANNGGTCQTQGVTMGGFVYFAANDAVNGDQLWRSDGTVKGTSRVSDIHPPNLPTMPNSGLCALALSGGRLYFNALQNPPGEYGSIYVSDGTAAGTQPALPVNAGIFASSFAATPDALYFAGGTTAAGGTGLYRVPAAGTPALTSAFPSGIQGQIAGPVGDKVVIVGTAAGTNSLQLYVTDGTTAGTLPIGVPASSVPDMFANNGWVYSLLTPAAIGDQADAGVWVTDGSAGGTQRLISGGSVLHSGRNIRGETLLETATTVSAGGPATQQSIEWLLSNGHSFYLFGTLLAPAPITTQLVAGTRLFFANSDSAGSELWAIADEAPAAFNDTAKVAAGASVVVSVLANDSDSDSDIDVRSVRIVDAPKGGSATVNSDGTVTYSANSSFSGADSFTYTVADVIGAVSAPATVAVTVSPASSGSSGGSGGGGSGGGGGGATGILELLVLGVFAVRAASRRRMTTRF